MHNKLLSNSKSVFFISTVKLETKFQAIEIRPGKPETVSLCRLDGTRKGTFALPALPLPFLDFSAHLQVCHEVGT